MDSMNVLYQDLMSEMAEEGQAYHHYQDLAYRADNLGLHEVSLRLRSISMDEAKHNIMLGDMLRTGLVKWEQEAATSAKPLPPVSRPVSRLFPSTIEEWQKLADDIVAKSPYTRSMMESAMTDIRNKTRYAEGAKRALVELAGELEIM
jgi:rubrerythrin